MNTVQKIFLGFTIVAVASTLLSSPFSASIIGASAGGVSQIYNSVKH